MKKSRRKPAAPTTHTLAREREAAMQKAVRLGQFDPEEMFHWTRLNQPTNQ